jgi:CheY-like chemotaxis protein
MRVLCVEDDALIAVSVCGMADDLGHETHEARDAVEALAALRTAHFDILLVDIGLHGMDGVSLAREALASWPHLGVVFSTGYLEGAQLEEARQIGLLLSKPYTQDDLRRALDEVAGRILPA